MKRFKKLDHYCRRRDCDNGRQIGEVCLAETSNYSQRLMANFRQFVC